MFCEPLVEPLTTTHLRIYLIYTMDIYIYAPPKGARKAGTICWCFYVFTFSEKLRVLVLFSKMWNARFGCVKKVKSDSTLPSGAWDAPR